MRKTLKWAGVIVLTPVLLFFTLAILLYIPAVQNWVVQRVVAYASDKTGMDISVDRVSLVFPLDLGVEGFRMIQQNDSLPQVKDTVADVKKLVVDVQLWPLFKKKVEIDAFEFNGLKLNTADFVHEARIKGNIDRLYLRSHGIDWGKETILVNAAELKDASVNVELSDTVPPDTSKSKNYWKITVEKLDIANTGVVVHMPGDTLQVGAYLGKAEARDGFFDLYKNLYRLRSLNLDDSRLSYDNNFKVRTKGLDYNHISLSDFNISVDSFYYCAPKLNMNLRACSFKEKSGIVVQNISGPFALDSVKISAPALYFKTPDSYLRANLVMDLTAFDDKNPGKLHLTADGSFGKQDIMRFMGGMPTAFIRQWPNQPLTVKTVLTGNMKYLKFAGLNVKLPTAFNINARGFAANLADMNRLRANVTLDARTYNLGFIKALAGSSGSSFNIPAGIVVKGDFKADGKQYSADFIAREGGGSVKAKADFNAASMSYKAALSAVALRVSHFLPGSDIGDFTGSMNVKGNGLDFLSNRTALQAKAGIKKFSFGKYNFDGIDFDANLNNGKAHACINSANPLLNGNITFNAFLSRKKIMSSLKADLNHADWYGMGLVKSPFTTSFNCQIDAFTDLKTLLGVKGSLHNLVMTDSARTYRPDNLDINLLTSKDTTHFAAYCGDFRLIFNGSGGYKKVLKQSGVFVNELSAQLKNKKLDVPALRSYLPLADLYLTTGKNNPLSRFIANAGYSFQDASIDIKSSPHIGLNGNVQFLELQNSSLVLDTVRFNIMSDSSKCSYNGQVRNNSKNKQYVFNAMFDGYVFEKGSGVNFKVYDARDSLGLKLGVEASMEDNGIKLHMLTDDPILGYKKFAVNEDNYLFMGTDRRLMADLRLKADDGTGIYVYTNDENTDALQDLTVGLNQFDLSKLLTVVPYMPKITGMMNGDFHLILTKEELSVSSSVNIANMTYEQTRMGNIGLEFVYMPQSDGTHSVDGMLMCNDEQVADINGSYKSEDEGQLDVTLNMSRLPMRLLNGFIPDRIIRMRGYADGSIGVKGTLSKPIANGELKLDSCTMRSAQYGVRMRLSEGPLRIVGSNLLFENFKMYANNDNPLVIDGNLDFSNLDNMSMDLRMAAKNCQVIDSKENRRSVAFGKAFVDFIGAMQGPVSNLKLLGRLDVLGSTDMSYILRDSPLSTDNQMDELVKFTNFNDTTETVVTHQPISGFTMDLTMNIAQGAHVMCYLNTDHSNYIDLMGGGSLRMKYGITGDISLTGRYTLDNGEMKYSLPIIPLKTFTIRDGSYIEFTGDPMNPKLNITATERTKANVSSGGGGQGRTVEFDCGVVITKTLSDMGLEFTLDAPEDMSLHNELQAMSVEQRGKLAVTMLTTGMYIADGNTSGFSMNNALSSFLQSEINNITGNALRTLDLSFGMDNATDASGNTHTDYSFKFAKRFWNNRIKIVVGGKVSTGADVANQNESFFDNVTLEYRLSNSSDTYVKLFYDNNAYDWLEGNTREYGVGFIWRRSLQHFKDIFSLKKKDVIIPMRPDTITTNKK